MITSRLLLLLLLVVALFAGCYTQHDVRIDRIALDPIRMEIDVNIRKADQSRCRPQKGGSTRGAGQSSSSITCAAEQPDKR